MTTFPQKSHIFRILEQSMQTNTKQSNEVLNQVNAPAKNVNIFQNIRLNQKTSNNIFNKPKVNIFNKNNNQPTIKIQQQSPKVQQKPQQIQVKIMYNGPERQNNLEKQENRRKEQRVKKLRQEEQIKKKNKIRQLELKRVESQMREIKSFSENQQIIEKKLINKEFQQELEKIDQNYEENKEIFVDRNKHYTNQLQTINENSIQQSAVKPRNTLIQSTHSRQSGLSYFQNMSQEEPQSNKKPTSNTLKNQQIKNEQFKMTDSLRVIKETNSQGIMAKTTNSFKSDIIKQIKKAEYELQIKKAQSQSQSSEHLNDLTSSRILQKKQVKDQQNRPDLTKSQNVCVKQNQNLPTETPSVNLSEKQRKQNFISQFNIAQEKEIQVEIQNVSAVEVKAIKVQQKFCNQKRKPSQNSSQELQVPAKLEPQISFGPQTFLTQRQKPIFSQKSQAKTQTENKSHKIEVKQYQSLPRDNKNSVNIFKTNIFKTNQTFQPQQNLARPLNPYRKQTSILKNVSGGENIFQTQNKNNKNEFKNQVPEVSNKIFENTQNDQKSDQDLPCFKVTKQQTNSKQKKSEQIKPVLSNNSNQKIISLERLKNPQPIKTTIKNQSPQKQKSFIIKESKANQENKKEKQKIVNYYTEKNIKIINKIQQASIKKKRIIQNFINSQQIQSFQKRFVFPTEINLKNIHLVYLLKDLVQKQKDHCKYQKNKLKIQQKLKNITDQIKVFGKALETIQVTFSQRFQYKVSNLFGNNKYSSKQNKSQMVQQKTEKIEKLLLKYRLFQKEKEIAWINIQQKLNDKIQINNGGSDSSSEELQLQGFSPKNYKMKKNSNVKNSNVDKIKNPKYTSKQIKKLEQCLKGFKGQMQKQQNNTFQSKQKSVLYNLNQKKTTIKVIKKDFFQKIRLNSLKFVTLRLNNNPKIAINEQISKQFQSKLKQIKSFSQNSQERMINTLIEQMQSKNNKNQSNNCVHVQNQWRVQLQQNFD